MYHFTFLTNKPSSLPLQSSETSSKYFCTYKQFLSENRTGHSMLVTYRLSDLNSVANIQKIVTNLELPTSRCQQYHCSPILQNISYNTYKCCFVNAKCLIGNIWVSYIFLFVDYIINTVFNNRCRDSSLI